MRNTVLKEMDKCSGCGLCETVCPAQAIKMEYDKSGFIYPVIQKEKCIDCGLCERKCVVKTVSVEYPRTCYAGVHLDEKIRAKSSSGGMFAALAEYTLEQGGVVFGAAVVPKGKIVTVKHIMIKNKEELKKLQGSKYVQSDIRECYTNVKQQLAEGKKVLFSGTPCQVAAMKNYLGKEYDDLLLVDLVCHGTPSILHWEKSIEEKLQNDEHISGVSFRGQEGYMRGTIEFTTSKNKKRTEKYSFQNDLYCSMFIESDSYRESCYQCRYARPERVGDITIGDFWGFEKAYDRAQIEKDAKISLEVGNSLIAVNTEKGLSICNKLNGEKMWFYAADYEEAVKYNPQLSQPSKKGKNRTTFLTLYKVGGWELVSIYGSIKMKLRKIIEHTS